MAQQEKLLVYKPEGPSAGPEPRKGGRESVPSGPLTATGATVTEPCALAMRRQKITAIFLKCIKTFFLILYF